MGEERGHIPIRLMAIGLELPHMRGATVWQRLDVHYNDECLYKLCPERGTLHNRTPARSDADNAVLSVARQRPVHLGKYQRWHYQFYQVEWGKHGLLVPCTTLHGMRLVYWAELYDPLPYLPIVYLLLSDARWHRLHKCIKWKVHKHWTLASLWPNYTQVVEETECGCGVRMTVGF